MTHFWEGFWLILGRGLRSFSLAGPKMGSFLGPNFGAKNGLKNGEVLRNVVLGSERVKMAQKQHIGNFQI